MMRKWKSQEMLGLLSICEGGARGVTVWPQTGRFGPVFPPPTPTYKVHSVLSQPVKALEKEEEGEEGDEARAEVVAEDSEGQAGLGHRVPGAL